MLRLIFSQFPLSLVFVAITFAAEDSMNNRLFDRFKELSIEYKFHPGTTHEFIPSYSHPSYLFSKEGEINEKNKHLSSEKYLPTNIPYLGLKLEHSLYDEVLRQNEVTGYLHIGFNRQNYLLPISKLLKSALEGEIALDGLKQLRNFDITCSIKSKKRYFSFALSTLKKKNKPPMVELRIGLDDFELYSTMTWDLNLLSPSIADINVDSFLHDLEIKFVPTKVFLNQKPKDLRYLIPSKPDVSPYFSSKSNVYDSEVSLIPATIFWGKHKSIGAPFFIEKHHIVRLDNLESVANENEDSKEKHKFEPNDLIGKSATWNKSKKHYEIDWSPIYSKYRSEYVDEAIELYKNRDFFFICHAETEY